MATTQKIVTNRFHVDSAKRFVQSISDNAYYMFASRHIPYMPYDANIPTPTDSVQDTVYDLFDNMLFGKRITTADVAFMINKYEWLTGTIYDMYSHNDSKLITKKYYTIVQDGSNYNVYKCLSNNNGAASTVTPSGMDLTPIESPNDGYIWKYMGTVIASTYTKFGTAAYAPFIANSAVVAAAIPGAVDYIQVVDGGLGYNNYLFSQFRTQDLRIGGVNTIYAIDDAASSLNTYYEGCIITMTSGAASGEYRNIVKYDIQNNQKLIYLDTPFDNAPLQTDTYEIYPAVYVFGDGNESANCTALAVIDPLNGNNISRVEILNNGRGIRAADAAVIVKALVGVTANATLLPIISPPGGHGSDPYNELSTNHVGVSVKFTTTEGGFIPANNDFRQIGMIKDPKFDNVNLTIDIANTSGPFNIGETVYQYRSIALAGSVTVAAGNNIVTGANLDFTESLTSGDYIFVTDNTSNYLTTVSSVTNSSSFVASSLCPVGLTGSGLPISILKVTRYGTITALATGTVTLSDCEVKDYSAETRIIGGSSYTTSVVTDTTINGSALNGSFNTFVALDRFVGTITTGTFNVDDEVVTQLDNLLIVNAQNTANTLANALLSYQATARLHSVADSNTDDLLYLSNRKHVFNDNQVITGNSSSAQFTLLNKYFGDLVLDSGDVLYIENIDAVTRASNKTETARIILEF